MGVRTIGVGTGIRFLGDVPAQVDAGGGAHRRRAPARGVTAGGSGSTGNFLLRDRTGSIYVAFSASPHPRRESAAGKGARFSFELPLPPATGSQAGWLDERYSRISRLAPEQTVRALVVDDVPENREVLAQTLDRVGAVVTVAADGEEGLAVLAAAPADIVFADIRMPKMGGSEMRRRIVERLGDKAPRIVAVTASALSHERQGFLDEGFDLVVDKPFRVERIYATLEELLGAEFEYLEKATAAAVQTPEEFGELPGFASIEVSGDLHDALLQAARMHSVTELTRLLDRLAATGEQQNALADHLRTLSRGYDMKPVVQALEQVTRRQPRQRPPGAA